MYCWPSIITLCMRTDETSMLIQSVYSALCLCEASFSVSPLFRSSLLHFPTPSHSWPSADQRCQCALVRVRASLLGTPLQLFASAGVELPSECIVTALLWIAQLVGAVAAKKRLEQKD